MRVLEGTQVDLLEPFPPSYWSHAASWMFCHKTFLFGDDLSKEGIEGFLRERSTLPGIRTWGIVDKGNLSGSTGSEVPLVGVVFFERTSAENGYLHVATSRKAWGERIAKPGLVEQAGRLLLPALWDEVPELQRLSAAVYSSNKPARALVYRLGFEQDGYFKDMGTLKGAPVAVVHYGLLRPALQMPVLALEV